MSPAPSRSLAPQCVKLGDALEICDAIIFDFYPGLPHMRKTYLCKKKRRLKRGEGVGSKGVYFRELMVYEEKVDE